MTTTILGLSGSLRAASYNTRLLDEVDLLFPSGTRMTRWARLAELPTFNEDDEDPPLDIVQALRAAVAATDAVLIATPEYNGSLPGGLKNALDWASRPRHDCVLHGKPTALIGASPGPHGATSALAHGLQVLDRIGADTLPTVVDVPDASRSVGIDRPGPEPRVRAALHDLVVELTERAAPPAMLQRAC